MGHRSPRCFRSKHEDGDDGRPKKRFSRGERATQSRKTSASAVASFRSQLHKVKCRLLDRDSDSDSDQSFGCPRGLKETGSYSSGVSLLQRSLRAPSFKDSELQHHAYVTTLLLTYTEDQPQLPSDIPEKSLPSNSLRSECPFELLRKGQWDSVDDRSPPRPPSLTSSSVYSRDSRDDAFDSTNPMSPFLSGSDWGSSPSLFDNAYSTSTSRHASTSGADSFGPSAGGIQKENRIFRLPATEFSFLSYSGGEQPEGNSTRGPGNGSLGDGSCKDQE